MIKAVLGQIDVAAKTNPNINTMSSTTFAESWHVFSSDYFLEMQGNLQDFVTGKLPAMITYWGSTIANSKFTSAGAKATLKALNDKLSNVATEVAIERGFIQ